MVFSKEYKKPKLTTSISPELQLIVLLIMDFQRQTFSQEIYQLILPQVWDNPDFEKYKFELISHILVECTEYCEGLDVVNIGCEQYFFPDCKSVMISVLSSEVTEHWTDISWFVWLAICVEYYKCRQSKDLSSVVQLIELAFSPKLIPPRVAIQ